MSRTDRGRQGSGGWAAFAVAVLLLCVLVAAIVWQGSRRNGGLLVYALDDAYIHMAVAKNLVEHGTWGTDPGAFAPATSSLAWPLLLAAVFALAGPTDAAALWLAFGSALALLAAARRELARAGTPPLLQLACLVGLVLATPMPALVVTGMEHLLHATLTVVLASLAATRLASESEPERGRLAASGWDLGGIAALAVATRYEALFLAGLIALTLGWRRRWRAALAVAAGSALPVVAFGLVSTAHGGLFLPSSLLLKSAAASSLHGLSSWSLLAGWYARVAYTPELLVLLLLALQLAWGAARHGRRRDLALGALFAGTVVIHCLLAGVGWLFRYEAYLVGLGVLAVLEPAARRLGEELAASGPPARRWLAAAAAVLALLPLAVRAGQALARAVPATGNVYGQHIQMARFVRAHLEGRTVALNDIGAVSYLTSAHVVDVYGLADVEVALARLSGSFDSAWLASHAAARDVEAALVYEGALGGKTPPGWHRVGAWRLGRNVVCGDDTVLVFAVRPGSEAALRAAFAQFARTLPAGVQARLD
ncbi:MAG TPA: hypothetical protein P5234_11510 [Thermoanaerobaculaceae bacterium]|nr:hypothetical protein [Thermoanaerobaculaceae bacterium]HRS16858.1 hypothetical protein [Thermoanaerobaculaceae bacterium]